MDAFDLILKAKEHLYRQKKNIFFAHLLNCFCYVEDEKCPTLGVKEEATILTLVYNSDFIRQWPVEVLAEFLKHEMMHVVFGHLNRNEYEYSPKMNICMDLSINSYLPDIPKGKKFVLPKEMNLPEFKSTWQYWNLLPEETKIQILGLNCQDGGGILDDHSGMSSSTGEYVDKIVEKAIRQSYESSREAGDMSGFLGDLIKQWVRPKTIPWQQKFRKFVAMSASTLKYRTWKKPSKRFGEFFKGSKKKQLLNIGIGVDESGSVSDEELTEFMAETDNIWKTKKAQITLYRFTGQVEAIQPFEGSAKYNYKRYSGGTCFQPVFDAMEQGNHDCVIMFTDGFNFETQLKYSKKNTVLWVITENGNMEKEFGEVIKLIPKSKMKTGVRN